MVLQEADVALSAAEITQRAMEHDRRTVRQFTRPAEMVLTHEEERGTVWLYENRATGAVGGGALAFTETAHGQFGERCGLGRSGMTVGIGAVCQNGTAVIVAADRMMTYGTPLNLQVEMEVKKIVKATETIVILYSGSVPDAEEVIQHATKIVFGSNVNVLQVAQHVETAYKDLKRKRVEDTILRPFLGVDFTGFGQMMVQSAASQGIAQILGMIAQHNLGLDLLVAGLDDTGGHIFAVSSPGVLSPLDTVGYAAIGSGGLHANIRLSLGGQGRGVKVSDTVHNVYEAKAAAEVAPGVGKQTDMAIITPHSVRFFDEAGYRALAGLRRDYPELPSSDRESLDKLCEEMSK